MAKYSIEIASSQNGGTVFVPTKEKLRGRWDFRNTAHLSFKREGVEDVKIIARQTPVIPGIIISLDTSAKTGTTIDPLVSTEDGRKILASINNVIKEHAGIRTEKKGHEPATFKLNQDGVKAWMFYMRSLVDGDLAQYVPGSEKLPNVDEIKESVPGKLRRDPMFDYREYGEAFPEYVNEVADKKSVGASS